MSNKPDPAAPKTPFPRQTRKVRKGATDTGRLFLNVDDVIRRPFPAPLTRYVE
jgi:hypothetical protein